MTVGKCWICAQLKPGRPVIIHNFTHPEKIEQDLTIFCEDCVEEHKLWCPTHDIPKIYALELHHDGPEETPLLFGGCYRCAWDKLRHMPDEEKTLLVALVEDLESGETVDALLPSEDTKLLEPLNVGDKLVFRLLLCGELYSNTPQEIAGQCILNARGNEVLLN